MSMIRYMAVSLLVLGTLAFTLPSGAMQTHVRFAQKGSNWPSIVLEADEKTGTQVVIDLMGDYDGAVAAVAFLQANAYQVRILHAPMCAMQPSVR